MSDDSNAGMSAQEERNSGLMQQKGDKSGQLNLQIKVSEFVQERTKSHFDQVDSAELLEVIVQHKENAPAQVDARELWGLQIEQLEKVSYFVEERTKSHFDWIDSTELMELIVQHPHPLGQK
jgi:acyl carrier protein